MEVTDCEVQHKATATARVRYISDILFAISQVEMVDVEMVCNRSYTRHQVVAMEEDMTTEFKGHRSILMEDENPKHWNPNNVRSHGRTRQPWSKYMAGFLNSGMGGTIYGGILDNGSVAGIALSPYQVAGATILCSLGE